MLRTDAAKLRWMGLDMRARWRRRVAVLVTYVVFWAAFIACTGGQWWGHPMVGLVILTLLVMGFGVFGSFGPTKQFEDPPVRVMVNGLDEWARYRFAASSFEEATEMQKAELLQTYRFGSFYLPGKPYLDEREARERDGAVRWSVRWIATGMACLAGQYSVAPHPVAGMVVAADFVLMLVLLMTLPQARVLWMERDPRELNGEAQLVEPEA
jgi:hypothetical protein